MKKRMILILAAVLLATSALTVAAGPTIRVTWNANTEPDLASYRVYLDGQPMANVTAPAHVWIYSLAARPLGLRSFVTAPAHVWIYSPSREGTFTFHVTAIDQAGNESGPSNTATATINDAPAPPADCDAAVIPEAIKKLVP